MVRFIVVASATVSIQLALLAQFSIGIPIPVGNECVSLSSLRGWTR